MSTRRPTSYLRSATPSGAITDEAPPLNVDALIDDPRTRVIVCCGAGGVCKTTTAAAVALRASERGRRVAVLTIDPARRLAQSLGLDSLDNTPRPVDVPGGTGFLDAMMLDMKRTFDEVVVAHASTEKAAQILANPFYQALSSSFAGTQEYMAMEKLGQLHQAVGPDGRPRWDLVVVDTPPSRSALDFLDAPAHLGSFLDGRFVRLLTTPARAGGRAYVKAVTTGVNLASSVLDKILGSTLVRDVQTLVGALDTTFGGFRERADETYSLLKHGGTAFVVVTTPERDALREAGYFLDRLRADDMPVAGVVVNRVVRPRVPAISADEATRAADTLAAGHGDPVAVGLLRLQATLHRAGERHERMTRHFTQRHRGIPVARVPAADEDVHDLDGLRSVGHQLADQGSWPQITAAT